MARLRQNQDRLRLGVLEAWDKGARCVMPTMATGGGKTRLMSVMADVDCKNKYGIVQAHRSELVGQLSLAWAEQGIHHDIVASASVRRQIIDNHLEFLGRSYYDAQAQWSVESVMTAIKREPKPGVGFVFQDEGHHCRADNTWGRALLKYDAPGIKWMTPTATAGRADGLGLGAHCGGLVNALVPGPGLAELMRDGFLVTYDILHPTASDLNMAGVDITASGEFNKKETAKRIKQSNRIVGDAVAHYIEHAYGKSCLVFAVDIEHATTLLTAYKARGVPCELVTGNDLDSARMGALRRFKQKQTLVLINVDLFGEGTDIAGVEVIQMCRPTASFPLFCQMIGRMLRLDIERFLMDIWDTLPVHERLHQIAISRKPKALLIDHVGNIHREFKINDLTYSGPPEGFLGWSIDGKTQRNTGGAIPQRTCLGCFALYERFRTVCPFCGAEAPPPDAPSGPEQVDGSLQWYDPEKLAQARAAIAAHDGPAPGNSGWGNEAAARGANKAWYARQKAQYELRLAIAAWAGNNAQYSDEENYKRFWFMFGIDVPTAGTLGASDADKLREKIDAAIRGS